MNVFETVADLARQIREAHQAWQGEWLDDEGSLAWRVEGDYDLIALAFRCTFELHTNEQWAYHPAVFAHHEDKYEEDHGYETACEIALAGWALDPDAFDAVVAAGVDAEYARAAHRVGVTDAWQLIEAWRSGIPVEYLGPLGGAA